MYQNQKHLIFISIKMKKINKQIDQEENLPCKTFLLGQKEGIRKSLKKEIKWLKDYIGKSCGIYSAVRIEIIQERIKDLSKKLKDL